MRNKSQGFTLIELLVVVAVLGVLMALVLGGVQSSRAAGRRIACESNLRQWGIAVIGYATARNGLLPRRGQGVQPTSKLDRPEDWFNALPPFMESLPYLQLSQLGQQPKAGGRSTWICPDAQDIGKATLFTYGMNMALSVWDAPVPDRIDRVGPTHRMVFMADAPGPYCATLPSTKPYSVIGRHNGAVNIVFLDGHVACFSGEYVGCGIGDPQRENICWFVPGSSWAEPSK
jgi:prepilin-type N-terminal cleavage/methylation domain-containing protein/prepilin-type processing-associated H-X9-DG protein